MVVALPRASHHSINATGMKRLFVLPSYPRSHAVGFRLVQTATDMSMTNRTILFADPPGSPAYVFTEVPNVALNKEVMDVAFVKLVGSFNFPGGIAALLRDHRFEEGGVNLGDHWKHKYLVDVDGMGYSGRFFSFLESDSAVLKATVYREFFEEWIQPWCVSLQPRPARRLVLTYRH